MPPPAKVLVIDDEGHIVNLVGGWLLSAGYTVVSAVSGEEALEKAQVERPDHIVLDRWMPFMDGCEVLKTLRQDTDLAYVPVVLIGSRPSSAEIYPWCDGLPPEAASYLYKPFSREQLLSLIESPRPGELPLDDFRRGENRPAPDYVEAATRRPWWCWWRR